MEIFFHEAMPGGIKQGHFLKPFDAIKGERFQRMSIGRLGARFDFDKIVFAPLARHDVDLPPAGPEVALLNTKPFLLKVMDGQILALLSQLDF